MWLELMVGCNQWRMGCLDLYYRVIIWELYHRCARADVVRFLIGRGNDEWWPDVNDWFACDHWHPLGQRAGVFWAEDDQGPASSLL